MKRVFLSFYRVKKYQFVKRLLLTISPTISSGLSNKLTVTFHPIDRPGTNVIKFIINRFKPDTCAMLMPLTRRALLPSAQPICYKKDLITINSVRSKRTTNWITFSNCSPRYYYASIVSAGHRLYKSGLSFFLQPKPRLRSWKNRVHFCVSDVSLQSERGNMGRENRACCVQILKSIIYHIRCRPTSDRPIKRKYFQTTFEL